MNASPDQHFLDAIRAAPDDEAPRLIYADWLEERGSPDEVAQATLIRSGCATRTAALHDPARIEHEVRVAALEPGFVAKWREELRPHRAVAPLVDRGLLAGFAIDLRHAYENLAALAELSPAWRELKLYDDGSVLWEALSHPAVERIASLKFGGEGIGDLGVSQIARSPRLANLQRLSLGGQFLGGAGHRDGHGLAALAASESLPRLVELDLSENPLAPRAVLELARSPLGRRLRSLGLRGAKTTVAELAEAEFPRLKELSLADVPIGERDAEALARGPLLRGVERLNLAHCRLGAHGLRKLLASGALASCVELNLSGDELTPAAAAALASDPPPNLTRLKLNHNPGLGWRGVVALAEGDRWTRLESLGLARTNAEDAGAGALALSPGLRGLKELDLSSDRLTAAGAGALASSSRLTQLVELRLDQNEIGASGAAALAGGAALANLTSLDLSRNRLYGAGLRALARGEAKSGPVALRRLRLDFASISTPETALEGLFQLPAAFPRLCDLSLDALSLDGEDWDRLISSLDPTRLWRIRLANRVAANLDR